MRKLTWRTVLLGLTSILALSTPPSIATAGEVDSCSFCIYNPTQQCSISEIERLCAEVCNSPGGLCTDGSPMCEGGIYFYCQ